MVLTAVVLAGCGAPSAVRSDRPTPTTTEAARYGEGLRVDPGEDPPSAGAAAAPDAGAPTEAPAADEASKTTGVALTVVDTNGTPRQGVRVALEGPGGPHDVTSDDAGTVRLALAPGTYRARAPEGCSGQLRVLRGSSAEVGVAAGSTTSGRVLVEVTPRYEVAGPVTYEGDAGWRVGEIHRVRFRLVDPCGGDVPPLRRYTAVRFVASPGVEVITPLSSSPPANGTVELDLRCVEADVDVALAMEDALDPRRRAEIFAGALMDEQRPPFCLQPR